MTIPNRQIDWSDYPNFSASEFACKCGCGRADMDPAFMDEVQAIRTEAGVPMSPSSGYRCPAHNAAVNGGPAHPTGKAADFKLRGSGARTVLRVALMRDVITGVGVQQSGDSRFLHFDTLRNGEHGVPRPWVWSYTGG